jgi:hypothetical protein
VVRVACIAGRGACLRRLPRPHQHVTRNTYRHGTGADGIRLGSRAPEPVDDRRVSRQHPVPDLPALEPRELGRDVHLARHRDEHLPHPRLAEEAEDAVRAARVELGEGVVEEEQGRASGAVAQRLRLEHAQRDRRGALLARRAEQPQVAPAERELEVVAVRAGVGDAPAQVERALGRERRRERAGGSSVGASAVA